MVKPTSAELVLAVDGTLKRCSRCLLYKPLRDFQRAARHSDGLRSECRGCNSVMQSTAYRASALARQRLAKRQMLLDDAESGLKRCASDDHDGPNPLPVELFSLHDPATGQLNSYCKICATIKADRWYREHLEQARQTRAAYRQANLEKTREDNRAYLRSNSLAINERRRVTYSEDSSPSRVQQLQFRRETRRQVFDHYGQECACCGSTKRLEIDHIGGGGTEHRAKEHLPSGIAFYRWLIRNGFPGGYQVLCRPCNASKNSGPSCRLNHATAS